MKTKYILTALCLPALFAACTNEEFDVENGNSIAGRQAINLTLSTTYGDESGAETRMVNQNGTFLWDKNDVLGACLLIDGDNENKIYSNNKFANTLTEASAKADFTTQSTTVVGEYLFYYNYNSDMTQDLTGVQYSLAEPQEYDPTGEKMMANNFMISPRIKVDGNEPGEITLPLTMRSIYAYGTLNLKLAEVLSIGGAQSTSTSSVNIQKIIIAYTSNVEKDGIINMVKVPNADLSAANLKALREGNDSKYKGKSDAELTTILLAEADQKLTAANTDYTQGTILDLTATTGGSPISQVSISCISDATPNGVALSKTGEFSTRVLLPTTADAGANVTVTVYTDKGKYTSSTISDSRIKAGHTVNLANPNRTGVETAFTMGTFTTSDDINAISEADFIASMAQFSGQGAKTVNTTVGNFDLTPKAIAAIPSNVTIKFISGATFNGDMALKNMEFAAGKTYTLKSGKITLASTTTFGTGANVEIKAGAEAIVGKTSDGAIYNVKGGKLTVNNLDAQNKPVSTTIGTIIVTDNGAVDVKTPIVITTFTLTKGTVTNDAEVSTIAIAKDGVLDNNETVTEISANAGTVNNYGTITAITTNSKTINQMGENSVIGTCATNDAAGVINTAAYSRTTVTANEGEIVYVENARIMVTSGAGNVTYKAPETIKATDLSSLSSAITKIEFAKDFTYTYKTTPASEAAQAKLPTGIKTLVFNGNLVLEQDWALNDGTEIAFVGAKADVSGQHAISTINELKLTVGVAEVADVAPAVATKLYIAPSTTVAAGQGKLTVNIVNGSGATVWNDGIVNGGTTPTPTGWSGNSITND